MNLIGLRTVFYSPIENVGLSLSYLVFFFLQNKYQNLATRSSKFELKVPICVALSNVAKFLQFIRNHPVLDRKINLASKCSEKTIEHRHGFHFCRVNFYKCEPFLSSSCKMVRNVMRYISHRFLRFCIHKPHTFRQYKLVKSTPKQQHNS